MQQKKRAQHPGKTGPPVRHSFALLNGAGRRTADLYTGDRGMEGNLAACRGKAGSAFREQM